MMIKMQTIQTRIIKLHIIITQPLPQTHLQCGRVLFAGLAQLMIRMGEKAHGFGAA